MKKGFKVFLAAMAVSLGIGWLSQPLLAAENNGGAANGVTTDVTAGDAVAGVATQAATGETETTPAAASSGSCGVEGADLRWEWTGDAESGYTLTISGSGAMQDYDLNNNRAPWYAYADEKKIEQAGLALREGITHIGTCAFQAYFKKVDTTEIYSTRFSGQLTIPETVETIGAHAFQENSFSGDLWIPDGVTSIGEYAFGSARFGAMFEGGVIVIGYGLKEAGSDIFSGYYQSSVGSTLYNLSETGLGYDSRLPWPKVGSTYLVTRHFKATVEVETTRKALPAGVRDDLTGYHSFPDRADAIKGSDGKDIAFEWYTDEALGSLMTDSISLTGDVTFYGRRAGVTGVDYGIFKASGTSGDTTWTVYDSYDADELPDTLVISESGAMADYENETDRPWDQYRSSLRRLFLEEGITYLGKYAFYGYSDAGTDRYYFEGELTIPSTVEGIGEKAFFNNAFSGSLRLPEKLTAVGAYAFADNRFSGEFILPPNLATISERAFDGGAWYGTNQFTYVVVPESVTAIGESAFPSGNYQYYNFSEQTFTYRHFNDGDPIPTDGFLYISRHYDDIAGAVIKRRVLPDGVAGEDGYPYADYPYAKYHSFPNELDDEFIDEGEGLQITWYTDADCTQAITTVNSFTGNVDFYAKSNHPGELYVIDPAACGDCGAQGDNVKWYLLGNGDSYTLLLYGTGEMQDYYSSQTPWYQYHYSKWEKTRKVVVSQGITRIGDKAFQLNSRLSEVTLPDTLKSIGKEAFWSCQSGICINSSGLPEGLETVGAYAFKGTKLTFAGGNTVLILPESLTEVGEMAFYCTGSNATVLVGSNVGNITQNELPQGSVTIYNFSKNELSGAVSLPTFTKRIVSPDGKSSKDFTRKILSATDLPVADYPETDYPQLAKYRSFPSELDLLDGKGLTWYSDESRQNQVTGIPEDGAVVYAVCPGHADRDEDGKCDYCNQGRILTINGAITAEIAFADSYTVPENLYLVDAAGNRVTTVTESRELTAVLAIKSVDLTLTDSIALNYKVTVAKNHVLAQGLVPAMTFRFGGRTYQPEASASEEAGDVVEYLFSLKELLPQQMSEKVEATVSLGEVSVSKKEYSVKTYCESMLKKDATALGIGSNALTALRTLLVDMLYYGDAAQEYIGQTADTTAGLTEEQKALRSADTTSSAYNGRSLNGTKSEDYQWLSARLQLRDRVAVVLSFRAKDVGKLTIKTSGNGQDREYTDFHNDGDGVYSVVLEGFMPTQYSNNIAADFYVDGKSVGQTVSYGVSCYVSKMRSVDGLRDILQCIWAYGRSASNYARY